MYAVSREVNADVPSPEPLEAGTFADWRRAELGPCVLRELSFAALEDGEVVGWATLGEDRPGSVQNSMTAVARRALGRGVARALKLAQIHAAHEAGFERIRTQTTSRTAPCAVSTNGSGTGCDSRGFTSGVRCSRSRPVRLRRTTRLTRHDFSPGPQCVRILFPMRCNRRAVLWTTFDR